MLIVIELVIIYTKWVYASMHGCGWNLHTLHKNIYTVWMCGTYLYIYVFMPHVCYVYMIV